MYAFWMSCILSMFVFHFVSRGFSHIKHYSLKSTELIIVTTWNFIAFNKHLDGQFCWKSFAHKACFILGSLFELMLLSKKKWKIQKWSLLYCSITLLLLHGPTGILVKHLQAAAFVRILFIVHHGSFRQNGQLKFLMGSFIFVHWREVWEALRNCVII